MKLSALFKKKATGRYRTFRQTLYSPDIGKYKTYGIKCSKKAVVNDVSCDLARAKYIARSLNQSKIDPSELLNVIESFL